MGEFLSTPLKDKQSEDGENSQVSLIKPNFKKKKNSFVTVHVRCKDGEKEWKMHI